eukprot:g26538.t1
MFMDHLADTWKHQSAREPRCGQTYTVFPAISAIAVDSMLGQNGIDSGLGQNGEDSVLGQNGVGSVLGQNGVDSVLGQNGVDSCWDRM